MGILHVDLEVQQDFVLGMIDIYLGHYAWYNSNNSQGEAHPVGQKETKQAFGLYDMHGNVYGNGVRIGIMT